MAKRADAKKSPLIALGDPHEWTDLDGYQDFVRRASAGEPIALVLVIGTEGSVPRGIGAAMAVRSDGSICGTVGGGNLEHLLIDHALESLKDGRPRVYHYDFSGGKSQNIEKACVGKTDFLVQPFVPRPKLVIFGAGHIGTALAPIACVAGFDVTVVDDRDGYPNPESFPPGATLIHQSWEDAVASLTIDPSTYLVVVTYGHAQDEAVIRACLHRNWGYLGMIGSRAKVAKLRRSLGTDEAAQERLTAMHAPIGLPLGGRTPGEIAVAICAELVAERHKKESVSP